MKLHIFGLLCCIYLVAASDKITKNVHEGENLIVELPYVNGSKVASCQVISNQKAIFNCSLNDDFLSEAKVCSSVLSSTFIITIKTLTLNEGGEWKVAITRESGVTENINYNIFINKYASKLAVPYEFVTINYGQQIVTYFSNNFENFESCAIVFPGNKKIDVGANSSQVIKINRQCGFRVTPKKEDAGKWILKATLKDNVIYYTNFKVYVRDSDHNKKEISEVNKESRVCTLEDSRGIGYTIKNEFCITKYGEETKNREGTWKVYDGSREMKHKNVVSKYDAKLFESSVTYANGTINLLCQIPHPKMNISQPEMNSCDFLRPDGELISVQFGTGYEEYGYYGNGINTVINKDSNEKNNTVDCGITIYEPKPVDYGNWVCLVKTWFNNTDYTWAQSLKILPTFKNDVESNGSAVDVYVKLGQPIEAQCKANKALSYCYIKSPHGAVFNLNKNERNEKIRVGLEMGECQSEVKSKADITDIGKWSCYMGVENGSEIKTDFTVLEEGSALVAVNSDIVVENKKIELAFKTLPSSEKIIDSCRWVSPRGFGMHVEKEGRYITEFKTTYCKLTINNINLEDDVGQWTCYSYFKDGEYGSATTVVSYHKIESSFPSNPSPTTPSPVVVPSNQVKSELNLVSIISITVAVSFFVCSSMGLLVWIMYKRRSAASQPDRKLLIEESPCHPHMVEAVHM